MQIYIENNLIYGFNKQKIFKARYIVRNSNKAKSTKEIIKRL